MATSGFATKWLEEKALFPELFKEKPDGQTAVIVVVPAFNEPAVTKLLDSLARCEVPDCAVEVIIIINAGPEADRQCLLNNRISLDNIETWKKVNKDSFFRVFVFDTGRSLLRDWGVGMARKTGMDEAFRRFTCIERPEGIIASLDADCTVEKNYFVELYRAFQDKKRKSCSIYFEHPLTGDDFTDRNYSIITDYELHLRYYVLGLKYACFPYAFHTVGSSMAVRASQYIKAGGMNRRQAGEDFYFIQKLVQLGGYFNLNTTTVYPSPRESDRVPFGTGALIARKINSTEEPFMTYNPESFSSLRQLFKIAGTLYGQNDKDIIESFSYLPASLKSFLDEEEWKSKLLEIKNNTSSHHSFLKRFFTWFNMFKIVKYLNYSHIEFYEKRPAGEAAHDLLNLAGYRPGSRDPHDLLILMRSVEKSKS